MSNLAIIPARGGSKRIPRKNIRDFLGKPIIAYSIETALESGLFDEVMVSTEDDEIAEVAKRYGAVVPFMRSTKNADDYATLADVIEEVKKQYLKETKFFDYTCCILPTAPMITINDLRKGYSLIQEEGVDSVRPVVEFPYPIQRAIRMKEGGFIDMFNSRYKRTRSQDLEPAYYDAGQFYWTKWGKQLMSDRRKAFKISSKFVQDIDNKEDWDLAEMKYKYMMHES